MQDIRRCQPGRCGLKLAASEMLALQTALAEAGEDWHDAVQDAFRSVILSRVQTYIREGHGALPALNDSDDPVSPAAKLTSIVQQSEFLTTHLPDLAEYLTRYPLTASPEVESFLYWSQERLGGRPVIAVTHVAIVRPSSEGFPEVLIAGKQIFATHYMEGSLAITALVRGSAGGRYLVYVHRSEVDFLRGFWRKLVRMIVERRVKAEAPGLLQMLRRRLESGEPPGLTSWGDRGHAIEDEHGVSRSSGAQDDASGGACAPAESRHSAARAGGGRPASQRFSGPGAQVRSELKLLPPR